MCMHAASVLMCMHAASVCARSSWMGSPADAYKRVCFIHTCALAENGPELPDENGPELPACLKSQSSVQLMIK